METGSPYFDMLIYGGVAGIMVGTLGLVLLFLFPTKPTPTEPPAGGVHVTSHNQLGGITAHSVNVDAQPAPGDLEGAGCE